MLMGCCMMLIFKIEIAIEIDEDSLTVRDSVSISIFAIEIHKRCSHDAEFR
jgi:hypothetical protein